MINITNDVIFHVSGNELDKAIRESLQLVIDSIQKVKNPNNLPLDKVTGGTRTGSHYLAFAAAATINILPSKELLGKSFVNDAVQMLRTNHEQIDHKVYRDFTRSTEKSGFDIKISHGQYIKQGAGFLLMILHIRRDITLPATTPWPVATKSELGNEIGKMICDPSELITFIRSCGKAEGINDPAFSSISFHEKRINEFRTSGTKFLLASGWISRSDINLTDLEVLVNSSYIAKTTRGIAKSFIDVLKRKYQDDCQIPSEFISSIKSVRTNNGSVSNGKNIGFATGFDDYYQEIIRLTNMKSFGATESINKMERLPGLDINIQSISNVWVKLQKAFRRDVKKESSKVPVSAMAMLNIYLFRYLPYWFADHPKTTIKFPTNPDELTPVIFITRRVSVDEDVPKTLAEYMQDVSVQKNWVASTYYGYLKQIDKFFEYLKENSGALPGCTNFIGAFSEYDYPNNPRSLGTNKIPLPARMFTSLIKYAVAMRDYINAVNVKIFSGEIDEASLRQILRLDFFIDAAPVEKEHKIKTPSFGVNGTIIDVPFFPLFTKPAYLKVKDGRTLRLLRPHILNQLIVALYTGLRHNHIQWLDAATFDAFVEDDSNEYSRLLVNTDKVKKGGWTPHVNHMVIDVLRQQLEWRNVVDEPGFKVKHYYNNHKDTSYPPFFPLFSYGIDGLPHKDMAYYLVWNALLGSFQAYMNKLPEFKKYSISKLLPANVDYHDLLASEKLKQYGVIDNSTDKKQKTLLFFKSRSTPHSTRVSVVSHKLTFLPAEIIGKEITGQTAATVAYYFVPDPEDIASALNGQHLAIKNFALQNQQNLFLKNDGSANISFIKADSINSSLARSMKIDVNETITRYGCLCLSLDPDDKTGIDVIKEKGIEPASFNKTEICPYGNQCPQDVIQNLGGLRRCAMCPYAIRSIDHLPALYAKERMTAESMSALASRMNQGESTGRYNDSDLDHLEVERLRLGEDLAGWRLAIETLELMLRRIADGEDDRYWIVEKPEIIKNDLIRISVNKNSAANTLARLQECVAYPAMQSEVTRAQFQMLKLQILSASPEKLLEAFAQGPTIDPAMECAGLLRSVVTENNLSVNDVIRILEHPLQVAAFPSPSIALSLSNLL